MSEKRQPESLFSRRQFISTLGAGAVTSVAGCTSPFSDDETDTTVSTANQVQLETVPNADSGIDDRTAVVSDDLAQALGLIHQQQIRITRPGDVIDGDFLSAVYTIRADTDYSGSKTETIWLSDDGLNRINATTGWLVSISRTAPHPELSTRQEAKQNNEFVEQSVSGNGNEFIGCAPHGGAMNPMTDKQAVRTASELEESAWACLGYNEGSGSPVDRWHISSDLIHPASFPKLAEALDYQRSDTNSGSNSYDRVFNYAVSFDGMDASGVKIGGLGKDKLKFEVRDAIQKRLDEVGANVNVSVVRTGDQSATDPSHIVNRISVNGTQGVQISQSKRIREDYWIEVTDAVIEVFTSKT